jgi:hypothetical protein
LPRMLAAGTRLVALSLFVEVASWEFEKCWECIAARVPLLYDFGDSLSRHSNGRGRPL